MIEIWKDIKGYEGFYKINKGGSVKSLKRYKKAKLNSKSLVRERIMKQQRTKDGYPVVTLTKDYHSKTMRVHRLVCETFTPNPFNKKEVNHINGIKTDNNVCNLEWVTRFENVKHAWETGLKNSDYLCKPVLMLSLDNKPIRTFKSAKDAQKETGASHISACCLKRKKRKTSGGYRWEFC